MKSILKYIILLFPFAISAQNDFNCALLASGPVPDDIEGIYSKSTDEAFLATFEPVTFRIFFWGINNDTASNLPTITEATVQEAMTRINNDFNSFQLFFELEGFDNESFNSTAHHTGANLEEIGTYAKQNDFVTPNSFNVYIPQDHGPGSGEARFNSTICAVQKSDFNDYTLTHELAHDFFILHTREFFNTEDCERVTRNINDPNYNANTAGDRVADTAAAPRYNFPTLNEELDEDNCLYIGNLEDCEGTPYEIFQEDILNYMSAFAFSCRSIFSTGQKIRMHESILADINNVFIDARVIEVSEAANEDLFFSTFKIIPNPVKDNIKIAPQEVQLSKIEVYDLSGKRVLLQESNFDQVFTSSLPKGIFFLRIQTQSNSIVKRFIKE